MSTYNGWTNYETWAVALWLDNEQSTQSYWAERAEEAVKDAEGDRTEAARELANALKEEVTDAAPDLGASLYADLLGAALSEVNWREIAEHYAEEYGYDTDSRKAEETYRACVKQARDLRALLGRDYGTTVFPETEEAAQ